MSVIPQQMITFYNELAHILVTFNLLEMLRAHMNVKQPSQYSVSSCAASPWQPCINILSPGSD